jgi:MarR family transcriptional regulator, lower aerobic nicotinate degradation pathway regulator
MNPHPSAATPCLPLELVSSPVILIGRLGFGVKRRAVEELEAAGSSLYDYSVLALLADRPCEAQASIADTLGLDRSQLVGLLDGLEERGLVERRRDPSDRRRHMVTLTAAGEQQLEQLRTLVKHVEDEFLAPLDPASRQLLHAMLLQIARHHDARFENPAEAIASVG